MRARTWGLGLVSVLLLQGACREGSGSHAPAATPVSPPPARGARVVEIPESPDGMSGLTREGSGVLWSCPERARVLAQVGSDGSARSIPLSGVPAKHDLESIAWLGDSRFALGTETQESGRTHDLILIARVRDGAASVTERIPVSYEPFGASAPGNQGLEGLCHVPGHLIAVTEFVQDEPGGRFALGVKLPLVGGRPVRFRIRLTSEDGKLSALACRPLASGIELLAVERHYEVRRLLRLTLPAADDPGDLVPSRVLDLGPLTGGRPNYEGLAELTGGGLALVVDNQQGRRISGPTRLVILPPAGRGAD